MNDISYVSLALGDGTGGQFTGDYVDLQGYDTEHGVMAVLQAAPGATPGTCGGYILVADSTWGTGASTAGTFSTLTSAGGQARLPITSTKRYAKFAGTAQTGKSMIAAAGLLIRARFLP